MNSPLVFSVDLVFRYNAESPDEAALVEAAANFGWTFAERVTTSEGSFLTVKASFSGGRESTRREGLFVVIGFRSFSQKKLENTGLRYMLLNVIEFNSTRKRMSVVVREMFGHRRLLCICKGADNVITSLLAPGQVCFYFVSTRKKD